MLHRIVQLIDPVTKDGQSIQSAASAVVITAVASNGGPNLCRVTTSTPHGIVDGGRVTILSVVGTVGAAINNTAANPNWKITYVSPTSFDAQASAFSGAYTSGGTATGALVGSTDGDAHLLQKHLDIYNQARMALVAAITEEMPPVARSIYVSGAAKQVTNFTFAAARATKPIGYVEPLTLKTLAGITVSVLPVLLRDATAHLDAPNNPIVYEIGAELVGVNILSVPNAATYIFEYMQVTDFTWADISGNVTLETINESIYPDLLEMAQAVAREVRLVELNAMGRELVRRKRGPQ
jgi:hypothetical protein